jgi:periplasmic protein TonB
MFETSLVHARSRALDRRHMLLTFSIAVHSAAIAAVIAASVASTHFPVQAPKETRLPVLIPAISIPPALGTQRPATPKSRQSAAPRVPTAPRLDIAPLTIPQAAATADASVASPVTTTGVGENGPLGVPGGEKGGLDVNPAPTAPYPVTGDVKAPIVIRRVTPQYPQIAVRSRKSGWVILECIIDKSGHIRDARVVGSNFGAFEQPALDAVQQWLFAPGTLHGEAVDTIFELTVRFEVR